MQSLTKKHEVTPKQIPPTATQGEPHDLWPGNILMLGASIKYEVEALEDSAFLLTIAWPDAKKLEGMNHRGYGT